MERIITKDVGRNLRRGAIYDFPPYTWKQVAYSIGASSPDVFSELVDEAAKRAAARSKRNDHAS